MSMERLRREWSYDAWANAEVLRHLQRESLPPANAVGLFAHVLGAQSEWLARLEGAKSSLAIWPKLTLDELGLEHERLRAGWTRFLEALSDAGLERQVSYTNSKGQPWKTSVEDILEHVLMHGAYHRGQIASALREAGITPPYTDYIHAARTGLLD